MAKLKKEVVEKGLKNLKEKGFTVKELYAEGEGFTVGELKAQGFPTTCGEAHKDGMDRAAGSVYDEKKSEKPCGDSVRGGSFPWAS